MILAADEARLERVLGLILDRAGLRVLDLACRTGVFATALAERGAHVSAIEGRQENVDLIRPHPNLSIELADVRSLSTRSGPFDISLCLGILYHLEADDARRLLKTLFEITKDRVIIDTHCWGRNTDLVQGPVLIELEGREYVGGRFREGTDTSSSIGNETSFWFAAGDLERLLHHIGFSRVERIAGTVYAEESADRVWMVARR